MDSEDGSRMDDMRGDWTRIRHVWSFLLLFERKSVRLGWASMASCIANKARLYVYTAGCSCGLDL